MLRKCCNHFFRIRINRLIKHEAASFIWIAGQNPARIFVFVTEATATLNPLAAERQAVLVLQSVLSGQRYSRISSSADFVEEFV